MHGETGVRRLIAERLNREVVEALNWKARPFAQANRQSQIENRKS
jgi:hypothetical protein